MLLPRTHQHKVTGWLLLLAVGLLLTACDSSGVDASGRRILLAHSWTETEAQELNRILDAFIAIHPDVTVITIPLDPATAKESFIERNEIGLGPDLFIGDSTWTMELAEAGLIQDLNGHPNLDTTSYLSSALETVRYKGRLYGLPLSVKTDALFYNKTLVTAPPENLDQFLRQISSEHPAAINTGFEGAFWGIQTFGGRLFDEDNRVVLDQGGFANWLGWLKNAGANPGVFLDSDREVLYQLFASQDVAFLVGNSDRLTAAYQDLGVDQVGVAQLPAGPNGPAGPFLTTEALFFNAYSSAGQIQLAQELAQFLTNVTQQTRLARQLSRIPANSQVTLSGRVYPAVTAFMAQSRTAVPLQNLPQMKDLRQLGDRAYVEALSGAIDLNQAAAELTTAINTAHGFPPPQTTTDLICPVALEGRLRVWHQLNEAETVVLRDLTRDFMRRCPGIYVSLTAITQEEPLTYSLDNLALGQGPDLLLGSSEWVGPLAEAQLIGSVGNLLSADDLQQYFPAAQNALYYDDQLYGIPQSLNLMALYYNTDQITEPARLLTELSNQVSTERRVALPTTFSRAFWGVTAFGAITTNPQANFEYQLEAEPLSQWLTWLENAQDQPGFVLSDAYDELVDQFAAGEVAYLAGESASLATLQQQLGADRVGVVPLPAGPDSEARPLLTARAFMVNAATLESPDQTQIALAYAQFVTRLQGQQLFLEQAQNIPSNVNVDTAAYPAVAGFLQQARIALPRPNTFFYRDNEAAEDEIYRALLSGQVTPAEASESFISLVQSSRERNAERNR